MATILLAVAGAHGVDVYVSPAGSDTWSGLAADAHGGGDGPLASLEGARQVIHKLKQAGQGAGRPITVHVSAGDYYIDKSFRLTHEDSGAADSPITYLGEGEVRLVGGRSLPAGGFEPVTDPVIVETLPSEVRRQVQCADLKRLGIVNYGVYPDAFRAPPTVPELFFNNQRMTLARWPNRDWATIAKVIESGPAEWRNHKSDALGVFEQNEARSSRWLRAPAVWLQGYWCFDWAEETIRVKSIDADKHQITLASRHSYGLGSGNPAPRRYCAVNLLEELDSPGEYFIDRDRGRLFFLPPGDLEKARVILSTLTDPVVSAQDASYITLRNLTVECGAGKGIEIRDGQDMQLDGCRIRNTGQAGITVLGGARHTIGNCDVYDTGTLGVSVEGGDRKTLQSCGHQVVNNHIYRPSRRQLTYAGHVHLGGVGVRVAHNLLHDGPHLAIILHGNDHLIEYNDIHDVATETDDCGAFYMGRNPSERGTVIRYNFWHNVGSKFAHGSCAVYFDDGAGGQTVFGNVFYRAAGGNFGAVFVHGGHDNTVANNIFIECKRALGAAPWDDQRWKDYVNAPLWQQVLLKDVDITRAPYIERYPDLSGFMQPDGEPRLNHAARNVAVRCDDFAKGNWEQNDNFVTDADPGFVKPDALDFRLADDSVVFQKIPGFERIPFSKIGMQRPASQPTSSSATRAATAD